MAERKPPTKPPRKTPAKRGPTKAAALKALGLSQKDLDYLKDRNSPSEAECTCGPNEGCSSCPEKKFEEGNVVEASANLKPGSGFVGGTDPQQALESRQTPPKSELPANWPGPSAGPQDEPVWYMRNLRGVEVRFRLSRQEDSSKKATQLRPRGQRGDIAKLEASDLRDPELQTQVAYGLVEVIPEGEALTAISKQYTNHQSQVSPHIAMLTNALGEQLYPDQIKFASDEEAYGIKVADLNPALMQGRLSDKEIKRDGGVVQPGVIQPVQNPSPGSIVTDGFMAAEQPGLGNSSGDNAKAAQVDALARSKQFEGPGAGVGEVTVKVAPVQRS